MERIPTEFLYLWRAFEQVPGENGEARRPHVGPFSVTGMRYMGVIALWSDIENSTTRADPSIVELYSIPCQRCRSPQ